MAVETPAIARTATPSRHVLSNGLTLIVRENHANPTVALQGIVRAGGIFDPPGKSGLAGFVGAMLDRGTQTKTAFEQASAVESLGAWLRFEGGLETLSISGNMLSEDLDTILRSLADALRNPAFPDDQIEKTRAELINEHKIAENSTASVASRRANELLFPEGHPYHWNPGGREETLRAITRDDLAEFHRRHYGPQTTTLALVGDVIPSTAVELAERTLGDWRQAGDPPPFRVPAAAPPSAIQRLVVPKPGKSQADVVYAVPGLSRTAPDYDAAMMMNYVLGGASLSSRLMDNLRDRHGLVYGVYSTLLSGIGAGPLQIRAGTNPANVDRTIDAILEQVTRLHDDGPTDEEMDAAKGFLTGVFPVRLETNAGVAGQLLSSDLYGLGLDYIERYPAIIRSVTPAAAKAAARRYLNPDVYALVISGSYDAGVGTAGGI